MAKSDLANSHLANPYNLGENEIRLLIFQFWGVLWDYFSIIHSSKPTQVIDKTISMDKIPQWFEGARLNYAENLLRFDQDDKVAFYFTTERRDTIGSRYASKEIIT